MSELSCTLHNRLSSSEEKFIFFEDRWFSTTNFLTDIQKVQSILRNRGVPRGARVLLAEGNSYAFLAVHIGLLTYGITIVPVNPEMPEPELCKVMTRSQAIGAFIRPELANAFHHIANAQDYTGAKASCHLEFIYGISADTELSVTPLHGAVSPQDEGRKTTDPFSWESVPDETEGIMLFTSGTTGEPKGVALTHRQLMAAVENVITSHRLTNEDVCYSFLPMFHINAQVIGVLSTLCSGGQLVVERKFSATKFWDTVQEFDVTWVSAVPTIINILLKTSNGQELITKLRFVRSASAPLPAHKAHRFETLFHVPVIESYGMTEAASQICINPLPPGVRKIGSVGLPVGVDLQVVDADGSVLPTHEAGEITIRGKSVIDKYALGDETGKSFKEGWFYTGDIGYMDEDGYVFITGRSKEMINRAGQKISPREVEDVITQHPEVKAVAVIGLPDEVYGERVAAYVIPDEDADLTAGAEPLFDSLRELCKENLSSYKCPAEYHTVSELPSGPTGKVQRSKLRQMVLEKV